MQWAIWNFAFALAVVIGIIYLLIIELYMREKAKREQEWRQLREEAEQLTYTYQIDRGPTFDCGVLIEYNDIHEKDQYTTGKQVEEDDALKDRTRYYFRARAVDSKGEKGPWAMTRFYLDTSYDDTFMKFTRVRVERVEASSGPNPQNAIAWDYSSDDSFWGAAPPCGKSWLKLDLGRKFTVSRIWQLCDKSMLDG